VNTLIRTAALSSLALLGTAVGGVAAAPEAAPVPREVARKPLPWAVPDAQEVVVLSATRPVCVRVTVLCEGKPVAQLWQERLRAAFEFFDRDKDGSLNEKETGLIFSDTGLSQVLQGGFFQPAGPDRPTLARLDTNKDGEVTFDEYLAYYKVSSAALSRPQPPQPDYTNGGAVTEAIFKLLDANGDGKLTRDEVKGSEKLLATLDADEDECLNQTELVPNAFNNQFARPVRVPPNGQPARPVNPAAGVVQTFDPARVPGTLTQQVIKKYDADGDFELTREEVAFDEATFARLDADGSGKLDGEEIDAWRTGPPDLEVALSLAPKPAECAAKLVTPRADANARGFVVKQVDPARLVVRVGRQPVEFWALTNAAGGQQAASKAQFAYLFQQAAGKKDHVLDKDLTGPNAVQFQYLRTLFDAADADADGKVTRPEFDAYFDLHDSFRTAATAITPSVQTPTLFELLDENRDGRIGVRELRTAWDRLVALDPGTGDVVTRAAITPTVTLRLTRTMERYLGTPGFNGNGNPRFNPNQVNVPQQGPVWFRKMDRNADGDVSRSEFLGTKAEFDAIDTDKDGLIGLAEAETFAAKARPAAEPADEKK
jgi:Ca2+-binding EF-hand superfamily protein